MNRSTVPYCAPNSRFGNRLAEGITIGYNPLSAAVPAEEYNSTF
jgi:hypothetical protein